MTAQDDTIVVEEHPTNKMKEIKTNFEHSDAEFVILQQALQNTFLIEGMHVFDASNCVISLEKDKVTLPFNAHTFKTLEREVPEPISFKPSEINNKLYSHVLTTLQSEGYGVYQPSNAKRTEPINRSDII